MNVRRIMRRKAIKAAAGVLLMVVLYGCSLEQDPKLTVTVEITGISDKADYERVKESLKGMVDKSIYHPTQSTWSGNTMTVQLYPVSNVQALSKRIDFGKVTEIQGQTVKVEFAK